MLYVVDVTLFKTDRLTDIELLDSRSLPFCFQKINQVYIPIYAMIFHNLLPNAGARGFGNAKFALSVIVTH